MDEKKNIKIKYIKIKVKCYLKCDGKSQIYHKEIDIEKFIQDQIQKDIDNGEESLPIHFNKENTTVEVSIDSFKV